MLWFRIDNRLIHGQVIEAWLPYLQVRRLLVVNDALAEDGLQQQIMLLAVPEKIQVSFVSVAGAATFYKELASDEHGATLFLLANCPDARRLAEEGVFIPVLNIGNMHYCDGKRQICPHVALSAEDTMCLQTLQAGGTALDFRCIPGDIPTSAEDWNNG